MTAWTGVPPKRLPREARKHTVSKWTREWKLLIQYDALNEQESGLIHARCLSTGSGFCIVVAISGYQ